MTISNETELKKTPLYDRHVQKGGKVVDFAGWALPIQYTSIMEEHLAVRNHVGIFDVSHLGEISVKGPNAFQFLQKIVPTDLSPLQKNRIQYSIVLNEKGGIKDDILIYKESDDAFYLVINAGNIDKIDAHLNKYAIPGVTLQNDSDRLGCIAVQGPASVKILPQIFGDHFANLQYYEYRDLPGWKNVWISRSGYTGEDGFEFFANGEQLIQIWDKLIASEKKHQLTFCGLGARNTLRLEVGNALYGHEMTEETRPSESRLGWLVSKNKKDYIGYEALQNHQVSSSSTQICGFILEEKGVARDGYEILKGSSKIGYVTSGSYSPTLKQNIGLARVLKEDSKVGSEWNINVHNRHLKARVVKLPFVPIKHL